MIGFFFISYFKLLPLGNSASIFHPGEACSVEVLQGRLKRQGGARLEEEVTRC